MTRTRRVLGGLAGSLIALALGATAAGAAATGSGEGLTASLTACHTDPAQSGRYAIFASQTTAASVPGTLTMAVSFDLEERTGSGSGFAPVAAPGFGTWVASQKGVGIFTYSHEVTGLPAPASFRVLVRARWLGRHHRVLHTSSHLSPVCAQPLLQPDLVLGAVTRSRGTAAGTVDWSIVVRNTGGAAAGPFGVSLSGAGAAQTASVAGLAAGASTTVTITAPRCPASGSVTLAVDPAGAVAEPADPARSRTISCG